MKKSGKKNERKQADPAAERPRPPDPGPAPSSPPLDPKPATPPATAELISRRARRFLIAAGVVLALGGVLYFLKNALAPVVVAIILAYLLDPLVDRMEARKINRSVAIFILAALVAISVSTLGVFFAVQAQRELVELYHKLPDYLESAEARLVIFAQNRLEGGLVGAGASWPAGSPLAVAEETLGFQVPATIEQTFDEAKSQLDNLDPAIIKPITAALKKVSTSTLAFAGWLLGLIIIPIFLFYFLRDWDRLKLEAVEYIPVAYRDYVIDKAGKIDEILSAFIRGQLTICATLGMLYSLGLLIVGVDLAVVIGMAAGLLFIVPYLGTVLGVVAASIMALLKFGLGWHLVGVWLVFGLVQLFEGTVLTPKVMGDKVGLSPVIVIFALLVGSDLLGILGMLIAVPAAALIKVFVTEAIQKYRGSNFFLEPGGPDPGPE